MTVNPPDSLPFWPSGFVMITSCSPADVLLAMLMLATICVVVLKLYELTVIPVPLKDRVAFGSMLLPFTVKLGMVWPWVPEMGATEMIDGGFAMLGGGSVPCQLCPPFVLLKTPAPEVAA